MKSRAVFVGLVMAVVATFPSSAFALVDPFGADDLDLIAYQDQVRAYTSGVDTWEVWVCDTTNGEMTLDPDAISDSLNVEMDPYFAWLSDARYRPAFTPGGVVAGGESGWPDSPFDPHEQCAAAVSGAASGTTAAAMIVVDVPYTGGFATGGFWCEVTSECPVSYPNNGRYAMVGGATVASVGGDAPAYLTIAHEIGHAISFPHSFGGAVTFPSGAVYEYDNAMDVMSGGDGNDLDIGTHGLNRYAAGWLDGARVAFHRAGTGEYRLSPQGTGGPVELLVLPTDGAPGVYDFLGARVRAAFDDGLPYEGIEVYHVDQSAAVCDSVDGTSCWGVDRRTSQVPVPGEPWTGGHVYGVGESFTVRGVTVQVLSFDGQSFAVTVSGDAVAERFVDDDGNPHEAAIAAIAQQGVTVGCSATTDRFCPAAPVSRAEMAVFLLRAIGDAQTASTQGTFSDVPAGAWYAGAVDRLAELGISNGYGDGTFRPEAGVSRAEMAVFLTRTFGTLTEVEPTGRFADIPGGAYYAAAAEGILDGGVTQGCGTDPLRYCPAASVRRDEMASFLARSLGLAS